MNHLSKEQVAVKIDNFFKAFKKNFGYEIPQKKIYSLMKSHLEEREKDYIIKYLGDFHESTIAEIVNSLENYSPAKETASAGQTGPTDKPKAKTKRRAKRTKRTPLQKPSRGRAKD